MGMFNERFPDEIETEDKERKNNWLAVAVCWAVGFVVSYSFLINGRDFGANVAQAIGSAFGSLIVPGFVGWIASRSTARWRFAFVIAFVVCLSLAVTGKIYQRKVEKSPRGFVSENVK